MLLLDSPEPGKSTSLCLIARQLKFSADFRWGGCIVAICDSLEKSAQYIQELKEKYYSDILSADRSSLDSAVFVTSPQKGAEILLPN